MFLSDTELHSELRRSACYKDYLNYQNVIEKYDKCVERLNFITKCRDSDIIPKFLLFRVPNNGCFDDQSVHNFQRRLLHKEIATAQNQLKEHAKSLDDKRSSLKVKLPQDLIPSVVWHSRLRRIKTRKEIQQTHRKKLFNLSEKQSRPLLSVENTVIFSEFSGNIPNYVRQTLALGPRHPIMSKFNENDVLVELDSFLNYCEKNYISDSTVTEINIKTLNYIKKCKKQKVPNHIKLTREFLKKNELIAVPFDKGIGYCVMPVMSYQNKLMPILNLDQFEKVEKTRNNAKNPIMKEEERVIETLKQLRKDDKISENLFNKLKPIGSQPPRLYGLAKVHKDNTPLRPVVSMPGSPYHNVAKQVAHWLSLVPQCNINCSTKELSDDLKNHVVDDNERLLSFDIVSLYTNVPVREAIDVCADLLFNHVLISGVDKDTFKVLATLASCDVVISTHVGYYKQVEGLAMGSSPAPMLANGWLSSYDNVIKGNSPLFYRYMDDIITICEKDKIDTKLTEINKLHPNLKFTMEIENNGCLPFLDMLIHNDNGLLSSSWYRKPTDTGLTLNFHSLAPMKYKRSVVIGFVHRIFRSCSSWKNIHLGLKDAKKILTNNQYPLPFIEENIKNTLNKILQKDDSSLPETVSCDETLEPNACIHSIPDKEKFLFFLNYRGKPTEHFAKSLKKLNAPCRVVMTLIKTKSQISQLKTPVPRMLQSSVVYKITCPGCDASYVGQTQRILSQRFREHTRPRGLVGIHFQACNISPADEHVQILGKHHGEKLLSLEALFINKLKPNLNSKDEYRSRVLKLKF